MILQALFLMLPAYFANMAPIFARNKLTFFDVPVDFNKKLFGQPIFGENKTIRGFLAGTVASIVIVIIQKLLFQFSFIKSISLINYDQQNFFILGFLFGFGALFGDLVKSFLKRRFRIAPSKSVKIIDQLDYVVGSLFFVSIIYIPPISIIILALVMSIVLTIIINHLAYYAKLRNERW